MGVVIWDHDFTKLVSIQIHLSLSPKDNLQEKQNKITLARVTNDGNNYQTTLTTLSHPYIKNYQHSITIKILRMDKLPPLPWTEEGDGCENAWVSVSVCLDWEESEEGADWPSWSSRLGAVRQDGICPFPQQTGCSAEYLQFCCMHSILFHPGTV